MGTVNQPLLVEREGELRTISEALVAAETGAGATVVIEGPPGIGKSRLVSEVVARALSRGFLVLRARGIELETDFGFGVVRQLLDRLVAERRDSPALFEGAA